MNTMILTRQQTSDEGTFGRLDKWYTLELPWRDNHPSYSCIPEGIYTCLWTDATEHFSYPTYMLQDVPGRTGIRIHKGNYGGDITKGYNSDILGCILLGINRGSLDNKSGNPQQCILGSGIALTQFDEQQAQLPFILQIVSSYIKA